MNFKSGTLRFIYPKLSPQFNSIYYSYKNVYTYIPNIPNETKRKLYGILSQKKNVLNVYMYITKSKLFYYLYTNQVKKICNPTKEHQLTV